MCAINLECHTNISPLTNIHGTVLARVWQMQPCTISYCLTWLSMLIFLKIAPSCLHDPVKLIPVIQSLKAFIDDIVLHASDGPYDSLDNLHQRAMEQVQWWEQLIHITGGSLNPKKCCAIVYSWAPDQQGILCLMTTLPDNDPIPISPDDSKVPIKIACMDEGV